MKRENKKLLNGLENLLKITESKLQESIDKNDVQYIKNEIEQYKTTYRKNKQDEKNLKKK